MLVQGRQAAGDRQVFQRQRRTRPHIKHAIEAGRVDDRVTVGRSENRERADHVQISGRGGVLSISRPREPVLARGKYDRVRARLSVRVPDRRAECLESWSIDRIHRAVHVDLPGPRHCRAERTQRCPPRQVRDRARVADLIVQQRDDIGAVVVGVPTAARSRHRIPGEPLRPIPAALNIQQRHGEGVVGSYATHHHVGLIEARHVDGDVIGVRHGECLSLGSRVVVRDITDGQRRAGANGVALDGVEGIQPAARLQLVGQRRQQIDAAQDRGFELREISIGR